MSPGIIGSGLLTAVSFSRLLAGVAFVALTHVGPAAAETMSDALARAYRNNPDINQQRAATRARDESVPAAKAGWLRLRFRVGRKSGTHFQSQVGIGPPLLLERADTDRPEYPRCPRGADFEYIISHLNARGAETDYCLESPRYPREQTLNVNYHTHVYISRGRVCNVPPGAPSVGTLQMSAAFLSARSSGLSGFRTVSLPAR